MQRFEITIDGAVQHGDYATQDEAEAEATRFRSGGLGVIAVRLKSGKRASAYPAAEVPVRKSSPPHR
ncbi:MAG TPA: hypothetical protein VNJ04_05220 [Gemmatimonadaceae bacterium]|nr:hypothetical protein [Gemmatimonadaceae bacterium]